MTWVLYIQDEYYETVVRLKNYEANLSDMKVTEATSVETIETKAIKKLLWFPKKL